MMIEKVIGSNGMIEGYKYYTDEWRIPCDKCEACRYSFIEIDENGNWIRDIDCLYTNPNKKKKPSPADLYLEYTEAKKWFRTGEMPEGLISAMEYFFSFFPL